MLRKLLKLQLVSPVFVGLGGPFCSLLSTLSGIHSILPFWALCPLWGLILVPLTCIFPSILPIYLLFALQKGYQQRGIPNYYDPNDSQALSAAQSPQDINQNTLWQDRALDESIVPNSVNYSEDADSFRAHSEGSDRFRKHCEGTDSFKGHSNGADSFREPSEISHQAQQAHTAHNIEDNLDDTLNDSTGRHSSHLSDINSSDLTDYHSLEIRDSSYPQHQKYCADDQISGLHQNSTNSAHGASYNQSDIYSAYEQVNCDLANDQSYAYTAPNTDSQSLFEQQEQAFARASQAQDRSEYIDGYLIKPCSVRQNIDNFLRINIFSNLMQNKYLIAMAQFVYWIVLAFTVYGINLLSNLTSERYISSSMQRQVLYTTSQESIDYSNTLITIFTAGCFVVLIAMLFAFVMSLVAATDCLYPRKVAALVILKNLPGFFVIICLMYAVIMLTERTYAHYVITAYRDIIMGNDYFNPAWLFMVLRIYIIHAFLSCFVLSMMMSLRILPGTFFVRPKQHDTSGSITQSAAYSQEMARNEFKSWRQAEQQRQMSDARSDTSRETSNSTHAVNAVDSSAEFDSSKIDNNEDYK